MTANINNSPEYACRTCSKQNCGCKDTDCKLQCHFYAATVRIKDLTDDEVWKIYGITGLGKGMALRFARSVIAADREKNK